MLNSTGGIRKHPLLAEASNPQGQTNVFFERMCTKKGFPGGSVVKNVPTVQETEEAGVWSLDGEDSLKEEMATHSSYCREHLMDSGAS